MKLRGHLEGFYVSYEMMRRIDVCYIKALTKPTASKRPRSRAPMEGSCTRARRIWKKRYLQIIVIVSRYELLGPLPRHYLNPL